MKIQNKTSFIQEITRKLIQIEELKDIEIGGLRPAAVMVPFVWEEEQWKLIFIERADFGAVHRKEVGFPGGGKEPVDQDLVETAFRETNEELGIPREKIKIIGFIKSIPTVSNYLVTPVVGIVDWPVELEIDREEVERVFTIPIKWLSDKQNWSERAFRTSSGEMRSTIFYREYDKEILWGLTARITQKLLAE